MEEKSFLDKFQEIKIKLLTDTINKILESTIQFFSHNDKGVASARGSGGHTGLC